MDKTILVAVAIIVFFAGFGVVIALIYFEEIEWKNAIVVFVIAWYIHIIVIVERVDVNYMRIKDVSQLEFDITPKKEIIFLGRMRIEKLKRSESRF